MKEAAITGWHVNGKSTKGSFVGIAFPPPPPPCFKSNKDFSTFADKKENIPLTEWSNGALTRE